MPTHRAADLKEREAQAAIESHASFVLDRLNSGAATVYANQQRIEAEAAQVLQHTNHVLYPQIMLHCGAISKSKSLKHILFGIWHHIHKIKPNPESSIGDVLTHVKTVFLAASH
jgi:hypothetical protein